MNEPLKMQIELGGYVKVAPEALEKLLLERNNAEKLAEALRDCVTTPGALAERSHEYALRRLKTITETAQAALARWEQSQ